MSQNTIEKTADTNADAADGTKEFRPDFGNGRYSILKTECYTGLVKLFRLAPEVAAKVAEQIGNDYGQAMANAKVEGKAGKTSAKGKIGLSESAKVKDAESTNALKVMHALQWAGEAGKHGVSYGLTFWEFATPLHDYFNEIVAKIGSK